MIASRPWLARRNATGAEDAVVASAVAAVSAADACLAIRLEDATRDYGRATCIVRALDRISLAVPRGQFVSVLGPSGSGKSTLLRLVAGVDAATAGSVRLFGRELGDLTEAECCDHRLRRVGQVFQSCALLPGIDVRENVALPLGFLGVGWAEARLTAEHVLERVGIARRVRQREPAELSGGDRQRVAIARALVAGPSLLLADEPTGRLDSRSATEILDLLAALAAERELTVVLATHAAAVATRGQRTVVLCDGRVVHDVMAEPRRAVVRSLRPATG